MMNLNHCCGLKDLNQFAKISFEGFRVKEMRLTCKLLRRKNRTWREWNFKPSYIALAQGRGAGCCASFNAIVTIALNN